MPLHKTIAMFVLGMLLVAGAIGMVRNWTKPMAWHHSMVTTTYGWIKIGLPARWAFYRAFPGLWLTLSTFLAGVFASYWLAEPPPNLEGIVATILQWYRPAAGVFLLVTASICLTSRPKFLIFPALRAQPSLLAVWDKPDQRSDRGNHR